ncbi:MAG: aminopeptidase P family protein [Bacteroidia bacterium]|nr:aminopeptidase P family protein [Bacteroidia bacterium]
MFPKETYTTRRNSLREKLDSGIVLMPGNTEAAFNYPANTYHFRQDSNFLYFFGLDHPDLAGVMDIDANTDYIFGNDVDMDDIIWMGPQPLIAERASHVGIGHTAPYSDLAGFLLSAIRKGRKIHFLPPYRGEQAIELERLLGIHSSMVKSHASLALIKAVVALREIKDALEIAEIEKAINTAWEMHTTAMKMAMPGVVEQEIAGVMEGIALKNGGAVSFPIILSINGQTLHNHYHGNTLVPGRMMVADAGCETTLHYASDITRTVPVGGKFEPRQKAIYEIVLQANLSAIQAAKPGVLNRDLHLLACKTIANGLKELGLMKGDIDEAVCQGAHALFMPHGLGHHMGLDVHDMEGLGEDFVGYDENTVRSQQFGLAFLRFGKALKPGHVFTIEPGCYFIPALIDQWREAGKFTEYINYDRVESYKDFGGVRIEDDVLVTENGHRVLGKPIPKTVAEIEALMKH